MYSCFTISMIKKPVVRRFVQFKTLLKYLPNARLRARINPTWHKIFFGGLDMGGAETAPPWKTTFWYFYEFKSLSNWSGT